jgi:hypothetical protein
MSKLLVVAMICTVRLAHADELDGPKDPRVARGLSIGGTAASLALTFGALGTGHDKLAIAGIASTIVTPSFGEWYAGKPVTWGMALRVTGGAVFLAAGESTLQCLHISFDHPPACNGGDALVLPLLLLGGLVSYAAGTAYDIKNAPMTARAYNAAHRIHVAPTPLYLRTPSGSSTMGLGLAGTF